jgi:hypothetical protein
MKKLYNIDLNTISIYLSRSKNYEKILIHPPLYYLYFGGFNFVFFCLCISSAPDFLLLGILYLLKIEWMSRESKAASLLVVCLSKKAFNRKEYER